MAAARPRQFTFDPRDTDERVAMELFDEEETPVEVLVTVPACDGGRRAELSVDPPGRTRRVLLPPGRGTTIEDLRDSEGRRLRLYLAATACPQGGSGGEGTEDDGPAAIRQPVDVADLMPDVVADIEADEDFEGSETLGDEAGA